MEVLYGAEYKSIVFVIDKSSSDTFSKNEATDLLEELVKAQKDSGASIKVVENIPFSSYEHWLQVLNQFYEQNISQYTEEVLEAQLREIYDNYTIDEIYEMQANQPLTW